MGSKVQDRGQGSRLAQGCSGWAGALAVVQGQWVGVAAAWSCSGIYSGEEVVSKVGVAGSQVGLEGPIEIANWLGLSGGGKRILEGKPTDGYS